MNDPNKDKSSAVKSRTSSASSPLPAEAPKAQPLRATRIPSVATSVMGEPSTLMVSEDVYVLDPLAESEYWRGAYTSRPYFISGYSYDEYAPAYRFGWESAGHDRSQSTFESFEETLARGWDAAKGTSKLGWDHAVHAVRDAWQRARAAVHAASAPSVPTESK